MGLDYTLNSITVLKGIYVGTNLGFIIYYENRMKVKSFQKQDYFSPISLLWNYKVICIDIC